MALKVRLREHLGFVTRGLASFEPHYVRLLRTLIKEGDCVFDIGANIGVYSVLFSRWVGQSGKVIAYEPDPNNLELLKRNLFMNGCDNTILRELALSTTEGEEFFSRDLFTGSTGHLGRGTTYGEVLFGDGRREVLLPVKTTTVDHETERYSPPHVIKLDIEGGEFDVLQGSTALLTSHRPLIMSELSRWNDNVPANATKASRAGQLLHDHGYELWDVDNARWLSPEEIVWMVLAIPRERVGEDAIRQVVSDLRAA
ncbi:MAG TPA: FkbM family methyltransferase [Pyrinomonadaceae bacterium]|nr:FkbM family methyltransferase [Pyrinomonadaceae bacterium]